MKHVVSLTILLTALVITSASCITLATAKDLKSDPTTQYGVISSNHWLLQITTELDVPSCAWLKEHNIEGLERADAYEITTEELCEL